MHPLEVPKKGCICYVGVMCPMTYKNIYLADKILLGVPTGYKYKCEKGKCPYYNEDVRKYWMQLFKDT